ncbi:MAG: hypothetical protein JNL88_07435 [Bacteroidia bacterium]|nr:hypothetical protein [Bacteroidia bacterium]
MKKTNHELPETHACFAFMPEGDSKPKRYVKALKALDPACFEEVSPALASIGEIFEKMLSDTRKVTVEEYLGFPSFPNAGQMASIEIQQELNVALQLLEQHRIRLDTLSDYTDEEIYRFITEELMLEEVPAFRMKDTYYHFLYEDFHSNPRTDIQDAVNGFLLTIFSDDWRFLNVYTGDRLMVDGRLFNINHKKEFRMAMLQDYGSWRFVDASLEFILQEKEEAMLKAVVTLGLPGTDARLTLPEIRLQLFSGDFGWTVNRAENILKTGQRL